MALEKTHEDAIYASVLADGRIHVEVPEGTEGAILRTYETSDKKTGQKWEHVYDQLRGLIKKVAFREGDFGSQIMVTVGDDSGEKPIILCLATNGNYGEDLMKKILAIDLEKEVVLKPYSFTTDDTKKLKKGVNITQGETKIANYFYDPVAKKDLFGYPKAPKGTAKKPVSKDEWKLYFTQVRIFLVNKISEHFKLDAPEDNEAKVEEEFEKM